MRFSVLGPLEVHQGNQAIVLRAPKQRLLLANLISRVNQPIATDTLIESLWDAGPPGSARKALGWHMLQLRNNLGEYGERDRISASPQGYVLNADTDEIDHQRFEALYENGTAHIGSDPAQAAAVLTDALDLWRGDAYGELADSGYPRDHADHLDELRLTAIEHHCDAELAIGRHTGLIPRLLALVSEQPYREKFRGQLMFALYRAGRQADALKVYREGRSRIATDLGLDPGPDLRRLEQQILTADPELDTPSPVRATTTTATAHRVSPAQLPSDTATFTGRNDQIAALVTAARPVDGPTRPVVVTAVDGMAGIGKTTLAVHVAQRLVPDYSDGQLFMELHGYSGDVPPVQPAEALERMLRALSVSDKDVPNNVHDRAALYRSLLRDRRMIIVLDNASSEEQVRHLLPGDGENLVIITSRRRLAAIDDAHHLTLDLLEPDEAVELFRKVAKLDVLSPLQRKVIEEVVDLCGRLPLAIRIAAAQLLRNPRWTAVRLRDRLADEQQRLQRLKLGDRSVSASFLVSLERLDSEHRDLYARLGLFPGLDFDTYAAAALAGLAVDETEQLLEDLVDSHLVRQTETGRFGFHDLLRQFAAEQAEDLTDDEREAAVMRLLDFYLGTSREASQTYNPDTTHPPPMVEVALHPVSDWATAAEWFRSEYSNLTEIVKLSVRWRSDVHTWRLVQQFSGFSEMNRAFDQQIELTRVGLAAARRLGDREAESRMLNSLVTAYRATMRYSEAITASERELEIHREQGDLFGQAAVLSMLGWVYRCTGQVKKAFESVDAALECAPLSKNPARAMFLVHMNAAAVAIRLFRPDKAKQHVHAVQAIADRPGSVIDRARLLCFTGDVARLSGDVEQALADHRAAYDLTVDASAFGLAVIVNSLASDHRELGDFSTAMSYHTKALAVAKDLDNRDLECEILIHIAETRTRSGENSLALEAYSRVIDISSAIGSRYDEALAHRGTAAICRKLGDDAAAEEHLAKIGSLFDPDELPEEFSDLVAS